MIDLGDRRAGVTLRFPFNTNAIAGESITVGTNGTVQVYKDGGTTQSTAGATFSEDFDSLTGTHLAIIDTSSDGTFYSEGSDFLVMFQGATIDGKAINAWVGSFSLANRAGLMPTTSGRKVDVSAGGEVGIDWANIGSPTTTLNLSGTTIKTATDVETDTADIQNLLPAALVRGRMSSDVIAISGDTVAADNLEAATDGTGYNFPNTTIPTVTTVTNAVTAGTVSDKTGYGLADGAITTAKIADGAFTAAKFASGAFDAVWTVAARTLTAISDSSGVTTLLSRLTSTRAGYLDNLSAGAVATAAKMLNYVRLLARKDAAIATDAATELTEINANVASGGGTYANTTDAQEAIRDRGDAAWTGGGGSSDPADLINVDTGLTVADLDPGSAAQIIIDGLAAMIQDAGDAAQELAIAYLETNVASYAVPGNVADALNKASATLSAAQAEAAANAAMLDVMTVDTNSAISAPPAVNAPLSQMIRWMFYHYRNATEQEKLSDTTAEFRLYADNETTVIGTRDITKDGDTVIKSEMN